MAIDGGPVNNLVRPCVPPRIGWSARRRVFEQGDDMDVLHRVAMVSGDPGIGGKSGRSAPLGGPLLVIAALVLLALSAAVFILN